MGFSRLKCQFKRKKLTQHVSKDLQVSTNEEMSKVNFSSFSNQTAFFKFVLALLAREKQNILMSQPCLHTLMQTRLSANQSVRTILIIL